MALRSTTTLLALCLVVMTVFSHPMGNFSISHYSLLTFGPQSIDLLYLIDMAEIPAFQEKPRVDLNGNGTFEANEQEAYLARKAGELTEGLVVKLNGKRYPLPRASQQLEFLPGGLNLPTLKISLKYQVPLKATELKAVNILEYEDTNFPGHAGWKEIVIQGNGIEESSASGVDKSQQLTHYPEDPAIRPPEDLTARVRFNRAPGTGNSASVSQPASSEPAPPKQRTSIVLPAALIVVCSGCGLLAWRWIAGRRRG
jgi:nickel/cobalt transporter (NicO) family protein